MRYEGMIYRPPGEWKSYLLQCTIGCSYNKCTFCAMYKEKKFRIRPVEEILEDIDMARDYYGPGLKRVFLMDGDAVIMKTDDLIRVLRKLYDTFKAEGLLPDGMTLESFSTTDETQGILSSQTVGPTVANDMRNKAYIAVILSLAAMFLYILLRFRNVAFSLGALAAVAFTAFSIIGFYSLFWGILPFAMEIDQTFIAAILTIIGYQINDTVVVFDRVRENVGLYPKQDFFTTINKSLNSTLGRTIMTSASTLLVLLCIFILGGDSIRSFIFAMLFGVITGTLSTIYIATPVAYLVNSRKVANPAVK